MGYIGAGLTRFNTADQLTVSGDAEFQGNANLGDNDKIQLGAGNDLQIYHDGSHSYVQDAGSGDLILQAGNDLILRATNGTDEYLRANEGLGVQIFYNGDQKFLTTNTGVDVTGTLEADEINLASGGDIHATTDTSYVGIAGGTNSNVGANALFYGGTHASLAGVTVFRSGSSEKLRIDSSGNVGIGCSPTSKFQVQGATTANNIEIGGNYIQSFNRGATPGYQALPIYASQFTFFTGGTERLRVDSSGRVLVGGTSTAPGFGNTSTGLNLSNDGRFFASVSGETHSLNRNTSHGDILQFRKDGSTVGTIGSTSGAIHIANTAGEKFIFHNGSGGSFYPATDNNNDLGASGNRWKDLFLSGGLYVGGTGSVNHLDDYEEGTFTPALAFAGGNTGITYTHQNAGDYVKIGKFVFVRGGFRINSKGTSTGNARITGLPFTIRSIGYGDTTCAVGMGEGATGLTSNVIGVGGNGSTNIYLYDSGSSGLTSITDSNFGTNTYILFSFCYNVE